MLNADKLNRIREAQKNLSSGDGFNKAVKTLKEKIGRLADDMEVLIYITERCYSCPILLEKFDERVTNGYAKKNLGTRAYQRNLRDWAKYREYIVKFQFPNLSAAVWVAYIKECHNEIVYIYENEFWTFPTQGTKFQRGTYAIMSISARDNILSHMYQMVSRGKEFVNMVKSLEIAPVSDMKNIKKYDKEDLNEACGVLKGFEHTIVSMELENISRKYVNITHSMAWEGLKNGVNDSEESLYYIGKILGVPTPSKWIMNKDSPDISVSNAVFMYTKIAEFLGAQQAIIKAAVEKLPTNKDRAKELNQLYGGYVKVFNYILGRFRVFAFGDPDQSIGPIKDYKANPIIFPTEFVIKK